MVLFPYHMSVTAVDIRDAAANIKLLLHYPTDSAFIGPLYSPMQSVEYDYDMLYPV